MTDAEKLTLRRVLVTLDKIPVAGRENLDHLLGAILAIEQMVDNVEIEGEIVDD